MIIFFIIFVAIGFIAGKMFPKGSSAYGLLLLIPIVGAFEYGIIWAIITYVELLLGVIIAYRTRRI